MKFYLSLIMIILFIVALYNTYKLGGDAWFIFGCMFFSSWIDNFLKRTTYGMQSHKNN